MSRFVDISEVMFRNFQYLRSMAWLSNAIRTAVAVWTPQVSVVRYRYHAEKIARGPLLRRYGYKDPIAFKGLLPRQSTCRIEQMPLYRPANNWAERRAIFGQNDYIDILGNEHIHPTSILYNVPSWLRGVNGNELQVLIRKKKMLKNGSHRYERPTLWKDLCKRIRYLHRFLNNKTKTAEPTYQGSALITATLAPLCQLNTPLVVSTPITLLHCTATDALWVE